MDIGPEQNQGQNKASTKAEQSSESLMLAYATGNADAFTQLYNLHKGPLFRFLLRQGMNTARADEMFQDIWLKIINGRSSYKVTARFQTWLYSIARNLIIDEYRKEGKTESVEFEEGISEKTNDSPLLNNPEEGIDQKTRQQHLLNSVKSLPFEQRQAFLFRYEAGMTNQDIAEITGTNLQTAKSRVRYAIAQLKLKLGASQ